jgi:hypothetical protein
MNRHLLVAVCLVLGIIACKKNNIVETPIATNTTHKPKLAHRDSTVYGTRFIAIDDANTMIKSYLYSINSVNNDTDLQSFSVDADSLRAYLSNSSIKKVKLIFAHTMNWSTTNNGVYAGYQSGGLNIVIAAYDSLGNYVYHQTQAGNCVIDYSMPCPYDCIVNGTASYNLLQ